MHITTSEKFSFMAVVEDNALRGPARGIADRPCARRGEHRVVVVELDDLHGAVGRGVEAQPAEHALVEVLLDELERAVGGLGVDVDRAGLGQLARELGVGGGLRRRLRRR